MDIETPLPTGPSAPAPSPKNPRTKQWVAGAAIVGALLGSAGIAMAQTSSDGSSTQSTAPSAPSAPDPSQGGHTANGITETLLTGDTATKVSDAAKAAVPDGTIERVENDAEGSPYEAHMVKSDGTHVTVKVDESFNVINVETDQGHGPGGPGGPGTPGAPQAQQQSAQSASV